MMSVGTRGVVLLCEPGRRLNSFMRLVERVRRNCVVRSAAQDSASGCWEGTGLRRGTPFWSAMVAVRFLVGLEGRWVRGCVREV